MPFWGVSSLYRGGEQTLLELHPKLKQRRFFLAKCARQNDNQLRRNKFLPQPVEGVNATQKILMEEMSHFVRHDNKLRMEKSPHPTPPKTETEEISRFARNDWVWESFFPFAFGEKLERGRSPRSNIRRSLTKGVRDDTSCRFWKGVCFPFRLNWGDFLASLEMTGYENHFFLLPLGKSWKGGEALVPILRDPSLRSGRPELRSVRKGETLFLILGDASLCSVWKRNKFSNIQKIVSNNA